ncbi:unnamed protein product [Boreogadus saida]
MPALVLWAVCVYPFSCQHRIQEMQILDATHINGISEEMHIGITVATLMTGRPLLNDQPTLMREILKCAFPVEKCEHLSSLHRFTSALVFRCLCNCSNPFMFSLIMKWLGKFGIPFPCASHRFFSVKDIRIWVCATPVVLLK